VTQQSEGNAPFTDFSLNGRGFLVQSNDFADDWLLVAIVKG
jgi:hypothetical protein